MKEIFAIYEYPHTLKSDNGANFASTEFAAFAKSVGSVHITSSPILPKQMDRQKML